ncbi:acetyl-CoA carboxylase biotin carboxylase subunit [Natranaerovirga pectinivora]|uniref:Biotin carboxylase n=1 Tax=Natranaerovirga pectinivora TaxID=682400 RepID=A0A4R3MF36_9FIRM|nr:acetyl-CoA carboxylase biotin carboxylase subunit [Natranaerovirga pectinivora]TCT12297.1 acetyl-CoA carboxylase biotin carboxylase subunit [Natranaerovirga pectinivora]
MFKKILIANRGEIAVRIIRACREMGIQTVAVYSEMDKEALHTQLADEAVCIGPAPAKNSYLNMENIINATLLTGAEAIHPGFGFLSENSKFAKMCKQCQITFIGPSSEIIDKMGNKAEARKTMMEVGVPIIPGSKEPITAAEDGIDIAKEIGYPVIIKASAGGGGKGMRIVNSEEEFINSFKMAQKEAMNSFSDDHMYIEKYLVNPRHIEFQILADEFGNVIHLGERDCSIQRRHQKLIEESPSVVIDEDLRTRMGDAAILAAHAVKYTNAGTIEFLLDKNKDFYFIEMNTRIQVEHPVSEMVTGIDLIKEQINIAFGNPLEITQKDVKITGHAIECRINAEDPDHNFRPSPGTIENLHLPGGNGIRIDSALFCGYKIPPTYDSMIAKLIVYGRDREEAIKKLRSSLGEFIVQGVKTNIDFQYKIINHPKFQAGNVDTHFVQELMSEEEN